jgi:hypothetical protein
MYMHSCIHQYKKNAQFLFILKKHTYFQLNKNKKFIFNIRAI